MSHELFANLTSFTVSLFRQLILIIELYNHYDVYDYLRQIALTLCSDKVSEVRWISYKLVSERKYWNMCERLFGHNHNVSNGQRVMSDVLMTD